MREYGEQYKKINMVLKTNRLILRPWCESDAEDLYIYASMKKALETCAT